MKNSAKLLTILFTCLISTSAVAQTMLRLTWWGEEVRHEKYNRLADLYEEQHPDVNLEREFAGWGPYWERLATQVAGGNAPDIIHMHQIFLNDYAGRGVLLDLTPLVEQGVIDLSSFPQPIVEGGRLDGKIYMISLGNSSTGTHYNVDCFGQGGLSEPEYTWTWDDFERTAVTLSEAMGPDVYGAFDSGGWDAALEAWMLQRGKTLFTGDGQLGFTKDDLREYWGMWQRLREANAIPTAEMTAEGSVASHEDSMLANGTVCMQLMSGNQHRFFQDATDAPLGLTTVPRGPEDGPSGDVVAGAHIALSSQLANSAEKQRSAAEFINWMINDAEVARIYNAEHGPPGSVDMQNVVAQQMEPADQRLTEMMQHIAPNAMQAQFRPESAGEVLDTFTTTYEALTFGQLNLDQAIDQFFDEADFILN